MRALHRELDAVVCSMRTAPEDFSMSSVRAVIAASGGATFATVIYKNTRDSTLKLTFCTLR